MFREQSHIFGVTPEAQERTRRSEEQAWYAVKDIDKIQEVVRMTPCFTVDSATPEDTDWIQSVTLP